MVTWDRRTAAQQAKQRDAALRRQLRDGIGPFSPYWRDRFSALRVPAASIKTAADLTKLPAVGERDVCPTGDPADAARLVLQADETGYALHTGGPDLRKALARRLLGRAAYRRQVEAEIRPTAYQLGGRAFRFPVASTRNDLDLVARAGNRAWQVLGLTAADVLVSAVPVRASLDHVFLTYAALGAGAPALFPGPDGLAETLRLVPATVLAVRPEDAVDVVTSLAGQPTTIRTVLLPGAPDDRTRTAVRQAAEASGLGEVALLGLYGPEEGRVMWAECRAGSGYHTYPDLDHVELVDPETGQPATGGSGGEVTLTQLGFRGTALLRWRTGDVVTEPLASGACPSCGRTVPRVPSAVSVADVHLNVGLRQGTQHVDLRAVTGALEGRPDVAGWMVEVVPSPREHDSDLLVLISTAGDETDAAVGAYRDIRAASGVTPSQVVVVTPAELAARRPPDATGGTRVVVRR